MASRPRSVPARSTCCWRLAERPGRLVDKRALIDLVWPGLVVQENNLAAQISALRKVFGGDVIATIPGRGYRFVARIEPAAQAAEPVAAAPLAARNGAHAAPAPPLRTNLPVELPALLGRADDLAALGTLIDQHRLVSIVGAGGIGKSLLTQHLLDARRSVYPQGVCWVELAPVTDAAALPGAVASALGVHGGHGEPLAALIAAAAPLTMLLALDNAEHLLADVADLCRALHDAAPGVRLVVTSQAPLRLAAERVFRIGPLAVPDAALPAAQALQFGAVALFAERVQAVDATIRADGRRRSRRSSRSAAPSTGLPLAIELAAARAPMLGLQQLQSSMQDRLELLTTSRNRAAPARQQTLRAALEWSHGFLQAREQQVFRRLGVMAGSASLQFIQQVLADVEDGGELDAWAVLDALDALVDRSLVAVLSRAKTTARRATACSNRRAPMRWSASAKPASASAVQRRHARCRWRRCSMPRYDEHFSGRIGVDDWLRRLAPDLDNARDALAWARAAGDARVELPSARRCCARCRRRCMRERMALADAVRGAHRRAGCPSLCSSGRGSS